MAASWRRAPWRRAGTLLLYGWMPVGIGWQLLNADRLDAYGMLGWFAWPAVPLIYLGVGAVVAQLRGRPPDRNSSP